MKKLLNIITDGSYKKIKSILIATLCAFIAYFIVIPLAISNGSSDNIMTILMILGICLSFALFIEVFYYTIKILPLIKSIKLSVLDGSLEHISEITEKNFDSNGRIAFSDHFFYDLKTNFFVAYSSILWVYPKDGGIIIRTTNGKKFRSLIDFDNLNALLHTNPQIMNGYNSDNYKKYTVSVTNFGSYATPNAETIVYDIPSAINNFWKWLSYKVKSKVFYTIGYTFEALFFIGLIIIANVDSPDNRIANWLFAIWISTNFIGLICLWIGHKVSGHEPITYKPPKKTTRRKATKNSAPPTPKPISNVSPAEVKVPDEKTETAQIKCKFCNQYFPESEIDDNGYCPHCAENWWKV